MGRIVKAVSTALFLLGSFLTSVGLSQMDGVPETDVLKEQEVKKEVVREVKEVEVKVPYAITSIPASQVTPGTFAGSADFIFPGNLKLGGGQLYLTPISDGEPVEGAIYYDKDNSKVFARGSSGWIDLAQQDTTNSDTTNPTASTLVIAASDSKNSSRADYVSDGVDDQVEVINAIAALPSVGGKIVLLEGTYSWYDTLTTKPDLPNNSTLEGQGGGTKIVVKSDVTPFTLRNKTDVAIRNLVIHLNLGSSHTQEVIELTALALGEKSLRNTFENITITNADSGAGSYTAILLRASDELGGSGIVSYILSNTFRNFWIEDPNIGIMVETANSDGSFVNGNRFDNFFIDGYVTGVEFAKPAAGSAGPNRNIFTDIKLQSESYSVDGFKNIMRNGNAFFDCLVWDWWKASSPNYAWSVSSQATGTYIQTTDDSSSFDNQGTQSVIIERGAVSAIYSPTSLGVGTSSPSTILDVIRTAGGGTAVATFRVPDSLGVYASIKNTTQEWWVGQTSNEDFVLFDRTTSGTPYPFTVENGAPTNSFYVDSTGRVGVGVADATQQLQVQGALSGYAGSFFNDGNLDNRQGVFIQGCLDTNPTTACNLLELRDGDGTVIGAIEGNGAGGVTAASGGSDYAELFEGNRNDILAGDIVAIGEGGKVVRAKKEMNIVGAYSTTPSNLGNWKDGWENDENLVPVALLGQVEVNVSMENGYIKSGDPIGVGSGDGVGVKADSPQRILGFAMEDAKKDTKIKVFISPSWHGEGGNLNDPRVTPLIWLFVLTILISNKEALAKLLKKTR